MPMTQPQGPFCQSCSMPLTKPEDFGTEANGARSSDYCTYCYQNGAFVTPDITQPEMIDLCVSAMVKRGVMPEESARSLMTAAIPHLKRWRASAPAVGASA